MSVTFEDILAARDRLAGQIERTPCRFSRTLSEITGANVWVKFENLQFTAAFKERGALNKLLLLSPAERKRGVIAAPPAITLRPSPTTPRAWGCRRSSSCPAARPR